MRALLKPIGIYRIRDGSLIDAELTAYYEGLRMAEEAMAELWREGFVQSAQAEGLREWEAIIRSTALESNSLAARRDIVLYTLSRMPGDFNLAGILRGLRSVGLECTLTEEPERFQVRINVLAYTGALRTYEGVLTRVCSILPAHVAVELDMGINTWDMLDEAARSFDAIDGLDYSWDEHEITGISP